MPLFISDKNRIFFIHIPKCGGSSIEKSLELATGDIYMFTPDPGVLPCTPQHLERHYLLSLFPEKYSNLEFFTVVRHPVLRMISEFFHEARHHKSEININEWVDQKFHLFNKNSYTSDNHIRPQSDFIMPSTVVYKFELGLLPPLNFALEKLGLPLTLELKHEKNWKKTDISLTQTTISKIESFYSSDMKLFNYETLVGKEKSITCSSLKEIVKSKLGSSKPIFFDKNFVFPPSKNSIKEVSINEVINYIRDVAIENEEENITTSLLLMEIAKKYRPQGPEICKKIALYKAKIENQEE